MERLEQTWRRTRRRNEPAGSDTLGSMESGMKSNVAFAQKGKGIAMLSTANLAKPGEPGEPGLPGRKRGRGRCDEDFTRGEHCVNPCIPAEPASLCPSVLSQSRGRINESYIQDTLYRVVPRMNVKIHSDVCLFLIPYILRTYMVASSCDRQQIGTYRVDRSRHKTSTPTYYQGGQHIRKSRSGPVDHHGPHRPTQTRPEATARSPDGRAQSSTHEQMGTGYSLSHSLLCPSPSLPTSGPPPVRPQPVSIPKYSTHVTACNASQKMRIHRPNWPPHPRPRARVSALEARLPSSLAQPRLPTRHRIATRTTVLRSPAPSPADPGRSLAVPGYLAMYLAVRSPSKCFWAGVQSKIGSNTPPPSCLLRPFAKPCLDQGLKNGQVEEQGTRNRIGWASRSLRF